MAEKERKQKAKIEQTAQAILDARALYPDCSLADLYDEITIPPEYKPHRLLGNYKDCMECHIESDTLLIWIDENSNVIKLLRLGTHSEFFG